MKPKQSLSPVRRKRLIRVMLIAAGLVAAVILYGEIVNRTGHGIPCLIRRLTGFSCGSCGMSRAVGACLRGHFREAFRYNPLFPLYAVYAGWVGLSNAVSYVKNGTCPLLPKPLILHILMLITVTLFGIVRNFFGI